jgi:hypothetical protein
MAFVLKVGKNRREAIALLAALSTDATQNMPVRSIMRAGLKPLRPKWAALLIEVGNARQTLSQLEAVRGSTTRQMPKSAD